MYMMGFRDCPGGGGFMKIDKESLIQNFLIDNVKLPNIHAGWFNELSSGEVPEQISFAHLDGDLYSSIMDSFSIVYDKMVKDGIILIDDYDHPRFPGVRKAVHEFMENKPEKVRVLGEFLKDTIPVGTKAYIKKL